MKVISDFYLVVNGRSVQLEINAVHNNGMKTSEQWADKPPKPWQMEAGIVWNFTAL